jgi:hypothetical protein
MDTATKFEIKPFSGSGDVTFGMTPSDVEQILGAPDQTSANHLGQRVEFRSFMNVAYTTDQPTRLCHLGFGRQMEMVTFGEINFFKDDAIKVLKKLIEIDDKPQIYLGFVVFLQLGITLTGFHDNDPSQKAVTVFEQGAWDKRIGKMQAFRLGVNRL